MAQIPILKVQDEFPDPGNKYTFPTTCLGYFALGDETTKILVILGSAAPSTNYDNAPLGSLFILTTAGSVKLYIYTAASTWTVVGAQS